MTEALSDDPASAKTVDEYVGLLSELCARSGLSLRRLERRARVLELPRWLPTSTVSDVFRTPHRLAGMPDRREFVESILRCCEVAEPAPWLTVLDRLALQEWRDSRGNTAHNGQVRDEGPQPEGPGQREGSRDDSRAGGERRFALRRSSRWMLLFAAVVTVAAGYTFVWFAATGAGGRTANAGPATGPAAGKAPGAACSASPAGGQMVVASALAGPAAKREDPTLDFGYMHGSAWYGERGGAAYYWGRGLSETRTGGVRLDWRIGGGPWHRCPAVITGYGARSGYVRTPAVRKVINGTDVVVRVCLWADYPRHDEKCTRPL